MKKMFCCLSVFLLLAITESFAIPREGTMTDFRDERTYKIVNTGSKTIMTENLRYNSSTSFNWTEALDISSKYQKKKIGM